MNEPIFILRGYLLQLRNLTELAAHEAKGYVICKQGIPGWYAAGIARRVSESVLSGDCGDRGSCQDCVVSTSIRPSILSGDWEWIWNFWTG